MKAKFIFLTFIVLTTILNACSQTTAVSEKLKVRITNKQNATLAQDKDFPSVLTGSIDIFPDRTKLNGSTGVDTSEVTATTEAGITVKLPPPGTSVEMDAINCTGYIGTAKVTFFGLERHLGWKVEFLPETIVSDVLERMKGCNPYFEDKLPMSGVFFVAPSDEKRKQIKTEKPPDWKAVLKSLPSEWRKLGRLDEIVLKKKKEPIEASVGWADSDGDGNIDLLEFSQFNQENSTYSIVIRLINGKWEKIWQTELNEKEYEP